MPWDALTLGRRQAHYLDVVAILHSFTLVFCLLSIVTLNLSLVLIGRPQ